MIVATEQQVQDFLNDVELLNQITEALQHEPLQLHELAEMIDTDILLLYDPISTLIGAGIVEKITTQIGVGVNGSNEVNFYFVFQN